MRLVNFEIGEKFFGLAGMEWLCTDKGTRSISAIRLDPDLGEQWFKGPPYSLEEIVFDESEMEKCYTNFNTMLRDVCDSHHTSQHPSFSLADSRTMMNGHFSSQNYPRKKILKRSRVGLDGSILRPYGAQADPEGWHILTFEVFTKEYSKMHENTFVTLEFALEGHVRARKKALEDFNNS